MKRRESFGIFSSVAIAVATGLGLRKESDIDYSGIGGALAKQIDEEIINNCLAYSKGDVWHIKATDPDEQKLADMMEGVSKYIMKKHHESMKDSYNRVQKKLKIKELFPEMFEGVS